MDRISTSHFSPEQWLDFVRGVANGDEARAMSTHLSGCQPCSETAAFWKDVSRLTARMQHTPSPASVRVVKAAFSASRPAVKIPWRVRVASVVFDSFLNPAQAAVRSSLSMVSGGGSRQLLVTAGDWYVHVTMTWQDSREEVDVVGQILASNTAGPNNAPPPATVSLRHAETPLTSERANDLGEFHFVFRGTQGFSLLIEGLEDGPVAVALPEVGLSSKEGSVSKVQ